MLAKKFRMMLVLVTLMVALQACGPGGFSNKATPTPLPPVVNYEKAVFTVTKGPIVSEKELQAEIVPAKQDDLFFRASGFVSRVTVKPGDTVKAGEILAELQVDDLMNQLQQAQIDLEVSQSNLEKEKVQHEYEIAKAEADVFMWEQRVKLAEMDLKNAYGDHLERAQINLEMTKKSLELARQNLDLLTQSSDSYMEQAVKRNQLAVERLQGLLAERQIVAPYDCIILRSTIRPGQQVDAFFSAFVVGDPAELVLRSAYDFELSNLMTKDVEVRMEYNRSDETGFPIKYLPNFMPVSVTDQTQVKGSNAAISQYFYFSVPENVPPEELIVGRQVYVVVTIGRKEDALLLPPAAIREYRGLNFVIVQEGERRRRVEIEKIGLKGTDLWEVIADLKEGDQVLGP